VKPILYNLGSLPIRSYGVAMALAFVVGILIARRRAKALGYDPDIIIDLAFFVIIASIVGARAAYVLVHWELFRLDPIQMFRIWDGGLAQYGGVTLGAVTGLLFFRHRGIAPWRGADIAAPSLAVGIAIGRIGCFLNGCCHGKACDLPWAVTFPPGSHAQYVFPGQPVHPTQLYASIAALVFFFVLMAVDRKKPFDGFLLWLFVMLLAVYRFAIDSIRHYEAASFIIRTKRFSLTGNQTMSIVLVILSAFYMIHLGRRASASGRA
jgi:phosphatidylglycerol:prolipoprotein diacylglycerol transferase